MRGIGRGLADDINRFAPPKANIEHAEDPFGLPRLHRVTSTALAVLLGGALPGGYMVVRNLIALGRRRDAAVAAILFVALFAATFAAQLRWPGSFGFEQLIVGMPRLAIAVAIAWLMQRRLLRAHKRAQGEFHSRWSGVAIGGGFLLVWLYVIGPLLTPLLR